jgi:hypothetical protein
LKFPSKCLRSDRQAEMNIDLTSIARDFLTECGEDYVGLWSLVWQIRRAGMADDSAVMNAALAVVTPLLKERKISAGQFVGRELCSSRLVDKHGFEEWKMDPQHVVARIEKEWTQLGRDPGLGEIVWFTTPGAAGPPDSC